MVALVGLRLSDVTVRRVHIAAVFSSQREVEIGFKGILIVRPIFLTRIHKD